MTMLKEYDGLCERARLKSESIYIAKFNKKPKNLKIELYRSRVMVKANNYRFYYPMSFLYQKDFDLNIVKFKTVIC
jgi:hypothetical protein